MEIFAEGAINPVRWALYVVLGVPLLGWLFFTRRNDLRLVAVVSVLIFIQQSFAVRRYIWAFGIGPSIITAYVALMAAALRGGRFPSTGLVIPLYVTFLFLSLSGVVVGSITGGLTILNVVSWQQLYLEGIVFFLLGLIALRNDEETERFLFWMLLVGVAVVAGNVFCLVTGYRFPDFVRGPFDEVRTYNYGGFFNNANSMGSFLSMLIPLALVQLMTGKHPRARRAMIVAAVTVMIAALVQNVHRGGILWTTVLPLWVLFLYTRNSAVFLANLFVGGVVIATAYGILVLFLPEFLAGSQTLALEKGASSSARLGVWPTYLRMAFEHPLGIGIASHDLVRMSNAYGIPLASPHNNYLTIMLQIGLGGFVAFMALVGTLTARAWTTWRTETDPRRKALLLSVLLPLLAFLLVGFTEPIWENGFKVNQLFWTWCGLSLATGIRAWESRRTPVAQAQGDYGLAGSHEAPDAMPGRLQGLTH